MSNRKIAKRILKDLEDEVESFFEDDSDGLAHTETMRHLLSELRSALKKDDRLIAKEIAELTKQLNGSRAIDAATLERR